MIGDGDHKDVGGAGDFGDAGYGEAGVAGGLSAGAAFVESDHYLDAAVVEVQGVGVALAAVADHADGFAGQQGEVGVFFGVDVHCHAKSSLLKWSGLNGSAQASCRAAQRRPGGVVGG